MARRIPYIVHGVLRVAEPPGGPEIAIGSPARAAWLGDPVPRSFSFRGTFTTRRGHRVDGTSLHAAVGERTA